MTQESLQDAVTCIVTTTRNGRVSVWYFHMSTTVILKIQYHSNRADWHLSYPSTSNWAGLTVSVFCEENVEASTITVIVHTGAVIEQSSSWLLYHIHTHCYPQVCPPACQDFLRKLPRASPLIHYWLWALGSRVAR